jgi:hypothetical protein
LRRLDDCTELSQRQLDDVILDAVVDTHSRPDFRLVDSLARRAPEETEWFIEGSGADFDCL